MARRDAAGSGRRGRRPAGAVDARLGYGVGAFGGRGTLTPFAETGLAGDGHRHLRIGTRFEASRAAFGVELAGERQESDAAQPRHSLKLDLGFRF